MKRRFDRDDTAFLSKTITVEGIIPYHPKDIKNIILQCYQPIEIIDFNNDEKNNYTYECHAEYKGKIYFIQGIKETDLYTNREWLEISRNVRPFRKES